MVTCATTGDAELAGNVYDPSTQKRLNVFGKEWTVPTGAQFAGYFARTILYVT